MALCGRGKLWSVGEDTEANLRLSSQRGLFFGGPGALLYWKHRTSQLTSRQVRFDAPPADGDGVAVEVRIAGAAELPVAQAKKP